MTLGALSFGDWLQLVNVLVFPCLYFIARYFVRLEIRMAKIEAFITASMMPRRARRSDIEA
jgi:hypothetical protein